MILDIEKKILQQHIEEHKNNSEGYMRGSKSEGKKVNFVAVFPDIIRRWGWIISNKTVLKDISNTDDK